MTPNGKFSLFKAPIKARPPVEPVGEIEFTHLYDEIIGDSHKTVTKSLRQIREKQQIADFKALNFAYITPNASCSQRKQEFYTGFSGYFVADFDDLLDIKQVRERLLADVDLRPIFLFTSPSGNGLKAMYNLDVSLIDLEATSNKMHKPFYSLNNYLNIFYGDILTPDVRGNIICGSGTDLLRACFLCHDPQVIYNSHEQSKIDLNFYSTYYPIPQIKDLRNKDSENINTPNLSLIKRLANKHLIADSHHSNILRFTCACRHYNVDRFQIENFLINSKDISLASSYYNNSLQIGNLIKDVYSRYPSSLPTPERNAEQQNLALARMDVLRASIKIDLNNKIQEPPRIIQIYEPDNVKRFASAGDFSLIIGKAKSRKSFFVSMMAAACISNCNFLEKFYASLPEISNKVIVFDTEQSQYDVQVLNERILRLCNLSHSPALEVYHLRRLNTKDRLAMIEYVLNNTMGLGVVIIDGVRDLVADINSPEEATTIANNLLRWSAELNIHILAVLHQNKADNNARGHLGTELINKAETVVSVAKDGADNAISIVTPEQTRGQEFQPFAFRINREGLPELLDRIIDPEQKSKKPTKKGPNNYPAETHSQILDSVYNKGDAFKYGELLVQIKLAFGEYGLSLGHNAAVEMKAYYENQGWVVKGSDTPYPLYRRAQGTLSVSGSALL